MRLLRIGAAAGWSRPVFAAAIGALLASSCGSSHVKLGSPEDGALPSDGGDAAKTGDGAGHDTAGDAAADARDGARETAAETANDGITDAGVGGIDSGARDGQPDGDARSAADALADASPGDAPDASPGDAADAADATDGKVPCHECTLWDLSSCGSGLSCQPRGSSGSSLSCIECRAAGAGKEGDTCTTYGDCGAGFGCVDGFCHRWCNRNGGTDGGGTCSGTQQCLFTGTGVPDGAGLCIPCGECDPAQPDDDHCGPGLSCSTSNGCSSCHQPGPQGAGMVCAGHSDCQRGMSCVSGVCRFNCSPSAAAGDKGSCPPATPPAQPALCVASAEDANAGACFACGECNLFSPPACVQGMKCVALDSGCLTCAPTGALPPGVPCTDHSDCDDGLFCLDGVCRAYCLAGAAASQPGSCGAGFGCVQPSPASDLGACLPCGECTGTGTDQCPAGQSCQSIAGCQVCARAFPHDQPAGAACQYNGDCQSHQCLDNACRNGCPPTSTSMCAATEICAQIQPAPSPLDLCLPCGECDVLAGSGCKAGFKCVAYGPSCSVCLVAGAHGEGTPCSALADCARFLTCANGVCRAYCDLDDPGSTCIDECVGAPTSLPPNVGQCLHCGECKPWAPDSCNSPALKCNNYGSCVVCEGAGGSGTEGQTCRSPGDCGRNYGCIGGRCRSYCNLNAQPGQAGTCMLPRTCQVVDANLQMRVGAGACL